MNKRTLNIRDFYCHAVISAAVLCGALPAVPVWAQGYAGNGLAAPRNNQPASPFTFGSGSTGGAGDAAEKRTNEWKVYGRYQFSETWGAEFNYADWGRNGISAPLARPGLAAPGASELSPRGSQLNLSATGTLPLTRGLSLTGKLGYGRNDITGSPYCLSAACGPLTGGSRDGARAGVGLRYSFNDNWGLRLDYENVNNLAHPNALPGKGDSWSARIRYTF